MIVMKFGGTSVGGAAAMKRVTEIVRRALPRKPAVVVSAVSKVTDRLLDAARKSQSREGVPEELLEGIAQVHRNVLRELALPLELVDVDLARLGEALRGIYLLRELTPRSLDYVATFGERLSSQIVAALFEREGIAAQAWTGWDAGIVTDDNYGEAAILPETWENLRQNLLPEMGVRVPVVTGFVGRTRGGERSTLGRGGSDYTAAIIGRALGVEEIQIWTDVTGILSCDPRVVPDAFTLRELTFAEAAELAYFGAKVLHPKTVEPAVEAGIPVRIVNTFEPNDPGTLVVKQSTHDSDGHVVQGLSIKKGNVLASVRSTRMLGAEGFLAELFGTLARHHVSVDVIATSEVSVSLTVEGKYDARLRQALDGLAQHAVATIIAGRAVVCVVGEGLRMRPGIAGEVFGVMAREGINVELISQGSSEINITFVCKDEDAERALRALHAHFLAARRPTA